MPLFKFRPVSGPAVIRGPIEVWQISVILPQWLRLWKRILSPWFHVAYLVSISLMKVHRDNRYLSARQKCLNRKRDAEHMVIDYVLGFLKSKFRTLKHLSDARASISACCLWHFCLDPDDHVDEKEQQGIFLKGQ